MTIITDINLLKTRRTKIIATVGPSCDKKEMIHALINEGVNVFRLNMSHGEHAFHQTMLEIIRSVARDLEQPTAILADLCGPKIRTGKFINGQIELKQGNEIIVTTRNVEGEDGLIPSQYQDLATDVNPGNRILLNDGSFELQVLDVKDEDIRCKIIHGGILKITKG